MKGAALTLDCFCPGSKPTDFNFCTVPLHLGQPRLTGTFSELPHPQHFTITTLQNHDSENNNKVDEWNVCFLALQVTKQENILFSSAFLSVALSKREQGGFKKCYFLLPFSHSHPPQF